MARIATLTMNPALDVTTSVDRVRPTHKLRCGAPRYDPGGGGINVARMLHILGAETIAVFPSGGHTGARIETLLREAGVPIAPIAIAGETRESITIGEVATGEQYRFVLPGPEIGGGEQARLLRAIEDLPDPPGLVVASGSLPPRCDPAILARLADDCRRSGARLIVDTSGPALAACEGIRAFLIKPSLAELEALLGHAIAPDAEAAACRSLIARGFADAILLSLGERGALLVTAREERRFAAIPVEPVSAVGAGDTMVAGLCFALDRGDALADAVGYAVAAAAAALLTPATELARREDIDRLATAWRNR